MKVKIKKLNPNAQIPKFKHEGDGAQDVIAVSYKYNEKYDRHEYGLGFATEFDSKYRARIVPRSSNTKTDSYLPNHVGLIDSSYRGEWMVFFKNRDTDMKTPPYRIGDAVGQMYFEEIIIPEYEEVSELSNTERGNDGGLLRDDKNFKV